MPSANPPPPPPPPPLHPSRPLPPSPCLPPSSPSPLPSPSLLLINTPVESVIMKFGIAACLLLTTIVSVNARKCNTCWLTSLQCSAVKPISSTDSGASPVATSSCIFGYSDGTYSNEDPENGLEPLVFNIPIKTGCGLKSYTDPSSPFYYCNKTAASTNSKIMFGQINDVLQQHIKGKCDKTHVCTMDSTGSDTYYSNNVGYTATIPFISDKGMKVFAIVYIDDPSTAGDVQMVELTVPKLDSKTGNVSSWKSVSVIDSVYSSSAKGVYQPAGGSLTPWCTAIGGEKVPVSQDILQFFSNKAPLPTEMNYGWVTESRVEIDYSASVIKRYALGRIQATATFAMPDKKTVYLSDGSVVYMFVSKLVKDLRNGTLYAANFSKETVKWVKLNSMNESDMIKEISSTPTISFSNYWEGSAYLDATAKSCNTGYKRVFTDQTQCWRPKSAKDKYACLLYPKDCAMFKGATYNLSGVTGFAYNMDDKGATGKELGLNKFFISFSTVSTDMQTSLGGSSVVRPCGSVYMFTIGKVDNCTLLNANCDDATKATSAKSPYTSYALNSYKVDIVNGLPLDTDRSKCEPSLPSQPSYIHFASYHNTLFIADGGSLHESNHVWLLDFSGQGRPFVPTSIFRAPRGSMIEGVSWMNNLVGDGRSYLSISVGSGPQPGFIGYLGPFTLKGYNAGSYDMLTNIGCPIRGEQDYLYDATKYVDKLS
uniref:Uncharacterized protein n=1 Tax=Hanusia phi TaxID=3032 RepID=A0A7S0EQM9_9CRYP